MTSALHSEGWNGGTYVGTVGLLSMIEELGGFNMSEYTPEPAPEPEAPEQAPADAPDEAAEKEGDAAADE